MRMQTIQSTYIYGVKLPYMYENIMQCQQKLDLHHMIIEKGYCHLIKNSMCSFDPWHMQALFNTFKVNLTWVQRFLL